MAGNKSEVTADYIENRSHKDGVGATAVSAEMKAALLLIVQKGADYARRIAPRDTGNYAARFKASTGEYGVGEKRRAEGNLTNDATYAAALEWGTKTGHRAQRPLGRTQEFLRGEAASSAPPAPTPPRGGGTRRRDSRGRFV